MGPSRVDDLQHRARPGAARTAVSRRPTAFSSAPTSPTAGLFGISASMALWAGLTAEGEGDGDSSGPPVPAGGAMSWHAAGRWTVSAQGSTNQGRRVHHCREQHPTFGLKFYGRHTAHGPPERSSHAYAILTANAATWLQL